MWSVHELSPKHFPPLLSEIPQPPNQLWYSGVLPPPELTLLAVVGSRNFTSYGKQVVEVLLQELRDSPIGIISGLAVGIDTLAHEAALKNGLYTLAIPGSGLDHSVIYPRRNQWLAYRILQAGGGLLSELKPTARAAKWTFPQRNRLMAGLTHATLLIEAGERSGTLITARMASDYNREVLAVPGTIFSPMSYGTNQFIQLGATPITSGRDILTALNVPHVSTPHTSLDNLSELEQRILNNLHEPADINTLSRTLKIPLNEITPTLMQLELRDLVWLDRGHYHIKRSA